MSRDTFDAVLASTPNGAVAGRVTGRGEHWNPKQALTPGLLHWSSPPPMRRYNSNGGTLPDLTGKKFGRLTVVGLYVALGRKGKGGARWVVRCACGDYEVRKTGVIVSLLSSPSDEWARGDRCFNCNALASAQWKYVNEGPRPITDFFTEVK